MKWLLALLLVSCSAQAATPTDDPRVAQLMFANRALEEQVAATKTDAEKANARAARAQCCGTFAMWNIPTTIRPGHNYVLGLPDTFTVRLFFTATTPVRTRIMSLDQFVAYQNGQPVKTIDFAPSVLLDQVFHDAEGCAVYVVVLEADQETVVTPRFEITRHLSPPSGVCAN